MKLYVNEKWFSLHRKFYVKDENNEEVYQISSKVVSIGTKTTITNMKGKKIAYIKQEILHLMPHYKIYIKDNLECKIKKRLQLFKDDYVLSNGYKVKGDYLMFDFKIYDDIDKHIGTIKRKVVSLGDKYEIEIIDTSKKELILAIIVAIVNDVNRKQSN